MDSEGNIYFLPPPSSAAPSVTPPPPFIYTAAPCSSLTLPTPPPRAPRARVSSQPLPRPAVPSCSPSTVPLRQRAHGWSRVPGRWHSGSAADPRRLRGTGLASKERAFACKHRFLPWDRGGRGFSCLNHRQQPVSAQPYCPEITPAGCAAGTAGAARCSPSVSPPPRKEPEPMAEHM